MTDRSYQERWQPVREQLLVLFSKECRSNASLRETDREERLSVERRPASSSGGMCDAETRDDTIVERISRSKSKCAAIEAAIEHGDNGYYGECADDDCIDGRISEERLRVIPYAIRCTECAERAEEEVAAMAPPPRFRFASRNKKRTANASF